MGRESAGNDESPPPGATFNQNSRAPYRAPRLALVLTRNRQRVPFRTSEKRLRVLAAGQIELTNWLSAYRTPTSPPAILYVLAASRPGNSQVDANNPESNLAAAPFNLLALLVYSSKSVACAARACLVSVHRSFPFRPRVPAPRISPSRLRFNEADESRPEGGNFDILERTRKLVLSRY